MISDYQAISRVTRSKASARAAYNRMSRFYDLFAGTSEQYFTRLGLQMLNARPGENILEIGFGTGHSLVTLARAVSITGTVTGLDISEGMLCITQSRLTHSSLVERVALNLGDAANLPFETARFDAVFVSFTLELFDTPEIPKVLEESARVLRPGGRLGVVALARRTGIAIKIYEWAHVRVPDYFDCRPIFVREVIEMAGFQVAGLTERSMWGLPVDILVARKTA